MNLIFGIGLWHLDMVLRAESKIQNPFAVNYPALFTAARVFSKPVRATSRALLTE